MIAHRQRTISAVCAVFLTIAASQGIAAENAASQPSQALLDEAHGILLDLRTRKAFVQSYRSESLLAQCANLRYPSHPGEALAEARGLAEPFYASLAVAGIAAQQLARDPKAAAKLLLEAQEKALTIDHWTGGDATSLGYLFQLVPLFERKQAVELLKASRANLRSWKLSAYEKSDAMLMLSKALIALDPAGVPDLLAEVRKSDASAHYYQSMQLLGRFEALTHKEQTARQVEAFYKSDQDWPHPWDPLNPVLLADALADLPKTLERVNALSARRQDTVRYYVAMVLAEEGRTKEGLALLEQLEARAKAKAEQEPWVPEMLPVLRRQLTPEKLTPVSSEAFDLFLSRPTVEALQQTLLSFTVPVTLRDAKQADAFLAAAVPAARQFRDWGYPHHGSPRSAALGLLAQVAALRGDWAAARRIAAEIQIPELKAMYLMHAYEAAHPPPSVVRAWPVYFHPPVDVRIGP